MEQSKIDRINLLAKKAKQDGLTDEEKQEQQQLRAEYIAEWRRSVAGALDNTFVQYPDGTKKKIEKKH